MDMGKITQDPSEMQEFLDLIEEDKQNIRRAIQEIQEKQVDVEFLIHPKSKTVKQSSESTGFKQENILKTLIFIADNPVAVLCPGNTTVSEKKLKRTTGHEARLATPEEVTKHTGYHIGGVSPFDLEIPVYMEKSILNKDRVKPAAGSKITGVSITPKDLKTISNAQTADISRN